MKTNDIRKAFLEFFAERGHRIVPSASLVPANDPTLLFTNAGMVPFKDAFLGRGAPPARRVTDVQRCLRAGGKHNDLENVGYTARHHTFFEMLGNWSFGDYFKSEATAWAWELLTDVFELPPERLWVTVYHTDEEAYAIWRDEVGVPPERIVRIGDNKGAPYASDNFWQMADTGPCGPCSEIFYDHDPDGSLAIAGGPPGSPDEDGDRFVEVWNLVFMQFDRAADGTLTPLPKPCVDTGMGLERIAAVLQGVHSNYDIDLFQHLIRAVARATGAQDLQSPSLKVISDHIRATAFLIADGVTPSNEGRGYVLRRIMRRAIRHGYKLGQNKLFFYKLVVPLAEEMGDAYPELRHQQKRIEETIFLEEERFLLTLKEGMKRVSMFISIEDRVASYLKNKFGGSRSLVLGERDESPIDGWVSTSTERRAFTVEQSDTSLEQMRHLFRRLHSYFGNMVFEKYVLVIIRTNKTSHIVQSLEALRLELRRAVPQRIKVQIEVISSDDSQLRTIDGEDTFQLYDTYGFPVDLTADIAREHGLTVDMAGFEREMEKQRARARVASKFGTDYSREVEVEGKTVFSGYEYTTEEASVVAIFRGDEEVGTLEAGDEGFVVLDRTPFYAESGGQVGDTGVLASESACFLVTDTRKRGGAFLHLGWLEQGSLSVGDPLRAEVDVERRQAIVLNHSATHLLHAALRELLGEHVTQKGSLVAPDRLRFDFSHERPVTPDELGKIEDRVNTEIRRNVAAEVREMPYDEAIAAGAMALFGEKYGDTVRVMRFGDFSTELCGGTHVARTGDIGLFKIVAESGIAAGIRRIEAVTGAGALAFVRREERRLGEVAELLKVGSGDAGARLRQLVERAHRQEKELHELRARLASGAGGDLAVQAVDIAGHKLLAARLDGADAEALRAAVDRLKDKLASAAIVLGAVEDGKVRLAAGVTKDLVKQLPAGELVNEVAGKVGGRGGGRPDFAQAGGSEPGKLDAALAALPAWVEARLARD